MFCFLYLYLNKCFLWDMITHITNLEKILKLHFF